MLHQKVYEMLHGLSVQNYIKIPPILDFYWKNDSIVLHSRKILTGKYKYDNLKILKSSFLYLFYTTH